MGPRYPVTADKLAVLLRSHPVPTVLLIGCLTAVDPADPRPNAAQIRALALAATPQWMRGSLGVAQAFVDSEAGVQFAVGMQYRLEQDNAVGFLNEFFFSLLHGNPGHVRGRGARGARAPAFGSPQPQSWSAPVVFRALDDEPMFAFLARLPGPRCPGPRRSSRSGRTKYDLEQCLDAARRPACLDRPDRSARLST